MTIQITPEELEMLIIDKLKVFYDRRIAILSGLKLKKLISKNLYLFRARGIQTASQLIEELMQSRLVKSDETIFGEAFFEEIAKAIASGDKAEQIGMDIVLETEDTYTVIEMKSASNWQNARMGRGIKKDFETAYKEYTARGLQKHFVPMLGQSTGRKNCDVVVDSSGFTYLVRSGQGFWQEITGDPDFYLKLVRLMKDYPLRFRPDYQEAWSITLNRLVKDFSVLFISDDGSIDWEKLIQSTNSIVLPRKTKRRPLNAVEDSPVQFNDQTATDDF